MIGQKQAEQMGFQLTNWGDPHDKFNSMYGVISRKEWQEEERLRLRADGIKAFLATNDLGETSLYIPGERHYDY